MCTKLTLRNDCGGTKLLASRSFEESGLVKFPSAAQRAVAAKERRALVIDNGLMMAA